MATVTEADVLKETIGEGRARYLTQTKNLMMVGSLPPIPFGIGNGGGDWSVGNLGIPASNLDSLKVTHKSGTPTCSLTLALLSSRFL